MRDPNYLAYQMEAARERVAAGASDPEIVRQSMEAMASTYTEEEKAQAAAIINARNAR